MKANELRIGNYFLGKGKQLFQENTTFKSYPKNVCSIEFSSIGLYKSV